MWPFTKSRKAKERAYRDAGMMLVARLVSELSLPGWGSDLLPTYSAEEIEAIDAGYARFQRLADQEGGGGAPGKTHFHPDIAAEIRRKIAADELTSYADRLCGFGSEVPTNWKFAASAYLKSWAGMLEPAALQNLGELLARAGHINAARETFTVILSFPPYARKLYDEKHDDLAQMILERANASLNEL
jgi:hypothetical protein